METGKILELADDIIYDSYLLQKHKMETSDEVDQFDIELCKKMEVYLRQRNKL